MKKRALQILFLLITFTPLLAQEAAIDSISTEIDSSKRAKNLDITEELHLTVGASFDFFNKQSTTDLYYDVNGFIKSFLQKQVKSKFLERFGLDFKLYQSRIVSKVPDSINAQLNNVKLADLGADSMILGDLYFIRSEEQTFEDLGLSINPTFKLFNGIYLLSFNEVLFKFVDTKLGYSSFDTLTTRKVANTTDFNRYPSSSSRIRDNDIYVTFGLGALFDVELGSVNLRLKPVIGLTGYAKQARGTTPSTLGYKYHASFALDVHVVEQKSGIKLGTVLRNMNITGKDNTNYRSLPTIAIYLSKQFSVKKFAEFFVSQ